MRESAKRFTLGPEPAGRWGKLRLRLRELLFGFFMYELWHDLHEQSRRYEDAMNVIIMGEFLGLPLMNSGITLRLLPYLLPDLKAWRERQLSDREVLERHPEIH